MCQTKAKGSPLKGRQKSIASVPRQHQMVHSEVKGRGVWHCCGHPTGGLGYRWLVLTVVGLSSFGLAASCWYATMSCSFFILSLSLIPKVACVKRTAFVHMWPCLPMRTHVCLVSLSYILAYCSVSGSAYLAGLPHSLGPLVLSHTSSQTCVVLHYTHFCRLSLQLLSLCLSVGTHVECLQDTTRTMLNKH
jgi:hypothetical protein